MDNVKPPTRRSAGGKVRSVRPPALLCSAVLLGVGAAFAVASPASAAVVSGVVKVEVESADDSRTSKSVTVECPDDKKVINAAGYITDGNGSVAMDDIFPDEALESVTVTGKETDAYGSNWRVKAIATCADEPVGLEWVWAVSEEDNSDDWKRAEAECTGDNTLLGTGATIRGGAGEVALDLIVPNGGRGVAADKVTVDAFELDPFSGDWTVNAFAICADPLDGQQVLRDATTSASDNDGLRVACDEDQVATGTGVELVGVTGEVVIDDVFPTDGSPTVAPTATTVYGQEEDGTPESWYIQAFVICADA
ncbi:hypothetical protein JD76_02542 [Micromonospora endolithica]|nr:hypothetical protein JD76_02542 [Micromonospora endolithica]